MTKAKPQPHTKLHRTLHLQHHRHTGRRLSREHTSYRGLAVVLALSTVFVAGLTTLAHTTADTLYLSGDLTVSAQIMAPIPAQAAVITDPLDSTTTGQAQYTVSGTCPAITPSVIIAVLDNGVSAGSAPCDSDNRFSATVSLVSGLNTLVARVYTITYQPGLDSTPVHLTYTPGSQSTGGGTSGNPAGGGTDTNNDTIPSGGPTIGTNGNGSDIGTLVNGYGFTGTGTGSGSGVMGGEGTPLVVGMDKPFITFAPQLDAVWEGSISGGLPGYKVTVYWGDGTHTNYTLSSGGSQSFRHHYKIMQPQVIDMYVSDSSGQRVERQYAAVTSAMNTAGTSGGTTSPTVGGSGLLNGMTAVGLYGAYVTLLAGFGALWARSHHHRQFAFAAAHMHHAAKPQRRRR